jgi:hypothetical protein
VSKETRVVGFVSFDDYFSGTEKGATMSGQTSGAGSERMFGTA